MSETIPVTITSHL